MNFKPQRGDVKQFTSPLRGSMFLTIRYQRFRENAPPLAAMRPCVKWKMGYILSFLLNHFSFPPASEMEHDASGLRPITLESSCYPRSKRIIPVRVKSNIREPPSNNVALRNSQGRAVIPISDFRVSSDSLIIASSPAIPQPRIISTLSHSHTIWRYSKSPFRASSTGVYRAAAS